MVGYCDCFFFGTENAWENDLLIWLQVFLTRIIVKHAKKVIVIWKKLGANINKVFLETNNDLQ